MASSAKMDQLVLKDEEAMAMLLEEEQVKVQILAEHQRRVADVDWRAVVEEYLTNPVEHPLDDGMASHQSYIEKLNHQTASSIHLS